MQYLLTEQEYKCLKQTYLNLGLRESLYFAVELLAYAADKEDGEIDKIVNKFMAQYNSQWSKEVALHPTFAPMLGIISCAKQYELLCKWVKENNPELIGLTNPASGKDKS